MSSQSSSYSSSPSDFGSSLASSLSTTPQHQEFLLYPPVVLVSSRAVVGDAITAATLVCCRVRGIIISIFREVLPRSAFPRGTLYVDHSPHILLPGLVDAHVHLNEPGRTEWEGFWTGTRAAAFGGVTTVIDMPLNAIPPTTSVDAFEEKIRAATGKCWVDVGFYGGVVPENAGTGELSRLVQRGVKGFKGFLIDSGVEEFPAVTPAHIEAAMKELATEPTTLMFHAEMDHPNHQASQTATPEDPHLYQTFLDSRPPSYETHAIQTIVDLAHTAPSLPLHIVHLSAVEAIPILQKARAEGVNITTETCFHYLSIAAEEIQEGDARHKCCPPIRGQSNQDGLWKELLKQCRGEDSIIKTVVSDHSPCTPNLKLLPPGLGGDTRNEKGNFLTAWGGVSSVGLGLPILWTEQKSRGFGIVDLVRWCCVNTAKQVGLGHKKGSLAVGMDADIAVFDDEAEFTVEPDTMLFRNKSSPYEGKKLTGTVRETWLRSKRIFTRSHGFVEKSGPLGALLLEPRKHNEHMKRVDSHDAL